MRIMHDSNQWDAVCVVIGLWHMRRKYIRPRSAHASASVTKLSLLLIVSGRPISARPSHPLTHKTSNPTFVTQPELDESSKLIKITQNRPVYSNQSQSLFNISSQQMSISFFFVQPIMGFSGSKLSIPKSRGFFWIFFISEIFRHWKPRIFGVKTKTMGYTHLSAN